MATLDGTIESMRRHRIAALQKRCVNSGEGGRGREVCIRHKTVLGLCGQQIKVHT